MRHSVSAADPEYARRPFVDGARVLMGGRVLPWAGPSEPVTSPILDAQGARVVIGSAAVMDSEASIACYRAAEAAWARGAGVWPQMRASDRIKAIEKLVGALKEIRADIVHALMWEICKSRADAEAEFDRTMQFAALSVQAMRDAEAIEGGYASAGGVFARVRRNAVGVMLCLGPFNYPFNETYTTLLPALLMGNAVVMKVPSVGGLAHVLTMDAYAACLPPGVVNFISGPGRATLGPLMAQGPDLFAFIGGSRAADALLREHPAPHRLKALLSLEGKNLALVTEHADVAVAVEQCALGALTFNGQRCTAVKLIFVHASLANEFAGKLAARASQFRVGLPWDEGVVITPLPEPERPAYVAALIADAVAKGAAVLNEGGGAREGNVVRPAVLFPVTHHMRLWHEEQFGPVVPVAVYSEVAEVLEYLGRTPYGQQAAVFCTRSEALAPLLDALSTAVGRINVNTQCSRSPDSLPFSGRRSSALGTLSVSEALRAFSTETVVAAKALELNERLIRECELSSTFLAKL